MAITVYDGLRLVGALAELSVGFWLARRHAQHGPSLAFAAFLVVDGLRSAAYVSGDLAFDPAAPLLAFRLEQVAMGLGLATEVLIVAFVLTLVHRHLPGRLSYYLVPLLIAGLAILAAYLYDPRLYKDLGVAPEGVVTQVNGPLGFITAWPTYLGAAFLVTVLWAREPAGPDARPLYAIALGFLFLRTAGGVFALLSLVGLLPLPDRIFRAILDAALYFGALGIFTFIAARGTPQARREARVGLAAVGAFALIFGILRVPAPQLLGQSVSGSFSGLAFVLFPALVVYGLLQGRLPGLETRARLTVRASTVAAVFVGIFLVVAEIAGSFFQNAYGWAFGGLAAGIAIVAIHPIQRVAERVANAAVPVERAAAGPLAHEDRVRMYREQARVAWADGNLSADERRMLDAAREHLGLTHEEAAMLERETMPGG